METKIAIIGAGNLGDEPMSDITDNYFKAIIRAVLDGNKDLLRVQVDSNLSASQNAVIELAKLYGTKKPTSEMKAAIALIMVLEFGLSSMKPYIQEVLEISEGEMQEFYKLFFKARVLGVNSLTKTKK